MGKSVIIGGFRHTIHSPRPRYPEAELWMQSTSARAWDWNLYDWSRWFDIHTVGAQSFYPGIRIARPDVYAWYIKQGRERPIYFTEVDPLVMGSVAYPVDEMEAKFGKGRFGCQLDYMAALALHEGFDRWILYGIGAPYVSERDSKRAQTWIKHHRTFLWWLRLAHHSGVDLDFDGPNMFTGNEIFDESIVIEPHVGRYGYDMGVSLEQWKATQDEGYSFHRT